MILLDCGADGCFYRSDPIKLEDPNFLKEAP